MTTEDDFQRALDAEPEDWQTRLVFADWLQERYDPRADGYRAMGMLKKHSMPCRMNSLNNEPAETLFIFGNGKVTVEDLLERWADCIIPLPWYKLLLLAPENPAPSSEYWKFWATRRAADDAAALAFDSLPTKRRTALLKQPQKAKPPQKTKRKKAK